MFKYSKRTDIAKKYVDDSFDEVAASLTEPKWRDILEHTLGAMNNVDLYQVIPKDAEARKAAFKYQGNFPSRVSSGITLGSCIKEERAEYIKAFETFSDEVKTVSNKSVLVYNYSKPSDFEIVILSRKDSNLFDVSLRIIDSFIYDKNHSKPSIITEWEANISIDSEAVCVLVQQLLENRLKDLDNKQVIGIIESFYTANFSDISQTKL